MAEVLPEFPRLLEGSGAVEELPVVQAFPFDYNHSSRARTVTAVEVRRAVRMLAEHHASGWTKTTLFNVLFRWAGLSDDDNAQSPPTESVSQEPAPDHRSHGCDLAEQVRRMLSAEEMSILKDYIIPHELEKRTLAEGEALLGIAASTLHQRAEKIRTKMLNQLKDNPTPIHRAVAEEFLREIMRATPGNPRSGVATGDMEGGDD